MMGEVLDRLTVGNALQIADREPAITVPAGARLAHLRQCFSGTRHASFAVVDQDHRLLGVVDDRALRLAVCDDAVREVLVAADLVEAAPLLVSSESLHSAMDKMVSSGREELVVVDAADQRRVVGMLSRRDLVAAYDHQIRRDEELRERSDSAAWSFLGGARQDKDKKTSPSSVGGGGGGSEDGEAGVDGNAGVTLT
jgi:CBS domain-containing protein